MRDTAVGSGQGRHPIIRAQTSANTSLESSSSLNEHKKNGYSSRLHREYASTATFFASMTSPLTKEQQSRLYTWVDTFKLSRPKRNFTRDFSDASLCAEVIHAVKPKLIDLHNYPPAHSVAQKIYNWNTLNFRVLWGLGCGLSEDAIACIAESKPGYIELLMFALYERLSNDSASLSATSLQEQNLYSLGSTRVFGSAQQHLKMRVQKRTVSSAKEPVVVSQAPPTVPFFQDKGTDASKEKEEEEHTVPELKRIVELQKTKIKKLEQLLSLKDDRIRTLLTALARRSKPDNIPEVTLL